MVLEKCFLPQVKTDGDILNPYSAHLPSTIALIGLACSYLGDTINENGLMIAIALMNAGVIALLSTLYIIRDHFR